MKAAPSDSNRFLLQRDSIYYYRRRVPARAADLDERAPIIKQSLHTGDLAEAQNRYRSFSVTFSDRHISLCRALIIGARMRAITRSFRLGFNAFAPNAPPERVEIGPAGP